MTKNKTLIVGILAVVAIATAAYADIIQQSCSAGNCTMRVRTGSTVDVDSGGTLDLNSGATFTNAGTGTHTGAQNFTGSFSVESVPAAVTVTCAQGAESGTNIALTLTFKDSAGTTIAYTLSTEVLFTTDDAGVTIVSSSTDPDGVTASTGITADLTVAASTQDIYTIRTNSAGVWVGTVNKSGADNVYATVTIPFNGQTVVCAVLDFD